MKNEVKNSLFNTILVSVCVFVGVGFITGAEIWFYFARFGVNMVFGAIVFSVVCFFLVYFALNDNDKTQPNSKFKNFALGLSELLVASAMVSGLLETTRKLFGVWWFLVFLIATCVMIFVFWKGLKSVIIYNYFVAIFIIFVIVSLFLFNNENSINLTSDFNIHFSFKNITLSCIFAVIYIFMNVAEMRPILSNYKTDNQRKKKVRLSLILSLTLILLVFTLSYFLNKNKFIVNSSMPFLLLFNNNGGMAKYIFLFGLILTLVSTAVACLSGLKEKCKVPQKDENFTNILVIISSLILGQIPFKIFVRVIYPIIGIMNFLIFVSEIFEAKKNRKKFKNQ